MKLLFLALFILWFITCNADEYYNLAPHESKLLADYKRITVLCEKSPICRKLNQNLKANNDAGILEKEINLMLMRHDLIQIKNDVNPN